jgi:hypothetical protein
MTYCSTCGNLLENNSVTQVIEINWFSPHNALKHLGIKVGNYIVCTSNFTHNVGFGGGGGQGGHLQKNRGMSI